MRSWIGRSVLVRTGGGWEERSAVCFEAVSKVEHTITAAQMTDQTKDTCLF